MTGRIRTVKPEWLEDELMGSASDEARLLSIALLLMADDYGRGRASIAALAAGAWRYQLERDDGADASAVLAKTARALRELTEIRFVEVYEVERQRYYAIRNWTRHQKVDKPGAERVPRPSTSIDPPTSPLSRDARERPENPSGGSRETLAPDLRSGSGSPITDREARARGSSAASETAIAEASARALGFPPSLAAPGIRDRLAEEWRAGYVQRFERAWAIAPAPPAGQHLAKLISKAEAQKDPHGFVVRTLDSFFADEWATSKRHPIGNLSDHCERYAAQTVKRGATKVDDKYRPAREWAPPVDGGGNVVHIGDAAKALLASVGLKAPGGGT